MVKKKTRKKRKKKISLRKRRNFRKKRKKEKLATVETEPKVHFRKIKIKVIGVGGGGGSIVSEIAPKLKKIKFVVANTDWQALKSSAKTAERFQFGQHLTHGLGTGMNPQLGEIAVLEEKEKIKKLFQDEDLSIIVATLGGGVGSGAAPVFAKIARESKNLTLGIFTMPFEFEGKKRKDIAEAALEKLRPDLNAFVIVPNNKIFQIIDQNTPLEEALSAMNKILAENLEGLIEMIHLTGLINIDFADLKASLEGRGRLAYLAAVQVQGNNRCEEAIKNVLCCPLYEYGISGAERILFNIAGSKDLSISEVEKISKTISDFNPGAKIILGLSQRSNYRDKIRITLLAVGCGKRTKYNEQKTEKGKARSIKKKRNNQDLKNKKVSNNNLNKQTNKKAESKKVNVKISKSALDVKKELDKVEKEIAAKENEWDVPAFLRKKH